MWAVGAKDVAADVTEDTAKGRRNNNHIHTHTHTHTNNTNK